MSEKPRNYPTRITGLECKGCKRSAYWDANDNREHHSIAPERGCSHIAAEDVTYHGLCPNGHPQRWDARKEKTFCSACEVWHADILPFPGDQS